MTAAHEVSALRNERTIRHCGKAATLRRSRSRVRTLTEILNCCVGKVTRVRSLEYRLNAIEKITRFSFIKPITLSGTLLARFGLSEVKSESVPVDPHSVASIIESKKNVTSDFPYRETIGSLTQSTQPDLIFAVNFFSRFLTCFTEIYCRAVKRIFRYVRGTIGLGIHYCKEEIDMTLKRYTDADYAGDIQTRCSTTGYIFLLVVRYRGVQKDNQILLSTTEAEYVAAAEAVKELVWLRRLLSDIKCRFDEPTVLQIDNQSAIILIKNPECYRKTKHIDIRYHFVKEKYEEQVLNVKYVKSEE